MALPSAWVNSNARIKFSIDGAPASSDLGLAMQGRLQEEIDAALDLVTRAYGQAARQVKDRDKARLQADIAAGGFYHGERLAKTWRGIVYPQKEAGSLEPAVLLWNKAADIVEAFSLGVTIRVRNAQFLAIPTPEGKAIIRRLNLGRNRSRNGFGKFVGEASPVARVAQAVGVARLVEILDPSGQHGVLGVPGRRFTPTGRDSKAKGSGVTPLFALVRQASLKQRIKGLALLDQLKSSWLSDFTSTLATLLPAGNR